MARHSLELALDPADDAAVRGSWTALQEAGLPSQADHEGTSNAPHVTVLESDDPLEEAALGRAVELLGPVLPVRLGIAGVLLLGERRPTLAWALDVPDVLALAVLQVRAAAAGGVGRGTEDGAARAWLPHTTLARRLRPEQVEAARLVLAGPPGGLVVAGLRHWDPETAVVRDLLAAGGPDRPSSTRPATSTVG